jgi:hypothetical protein
VVFHPARCVLTHSGLSKEWYGGEGCDLHGLCLVLLESAKARFLGVDPQNYLCHHMSGME